MMPQHIFESALIWALLYLPYHFALRQERFFRYNRLYLLASLAFGAFLPLLPRWESTPWPELELSLPELIVRPDAPTVAGLVSGEGNMEDWLFRSSGLVSLFLLGEFCWGLLRLSYWRWRYPSEQRDGYVLIHTPIAQPTFSFFKWVFLGQAAALDAEGRQQVLAHELAHVRAKHSADVVFAKLLSIAFFPNTIPWLYLRALRSVHEYQADAAVWPTVGRKTYGQLLLRQCQARPQLALANHFQQSQIKNRIHMMIRPNSSASARFKYLFALPALFAAFALLAFWQGPVPQASKARPGLSATDTLPPSPSRSAGTDVQFVVDDMPRFPGCEDEADPETRKACAERKLVEYLASQVNYPEAARRDSIQGTAVVSFVVEKDGRISNAKISRNPGGGTGEEALRVVEGMPAWQPGKQDGQPVRVQYHLPLRFKLD